MLDLNTLLDSSGVGWNIINGQGINDAGQIIAIAHYDPARRWSPDGICDTRAAHTRCPRAPVHIVRHHPVHRCNVPPAPPDLTHHTPCVKPCVKSSGGSGKGNRNGFKQKRGVGNQEPNWIPVPDP